MAQCGARNWSPARSQYCHLCIHPCKSPEGFLPQKLPSRRTCANCGVGSQGLDPPPLQPSPHLEYLSSSGCGPYLTPILIQCYSQLTSPIPCTSRACVCCLLLFCSLAPFCSAFAFCSGESRSSQLPSHLSFDTKLQEQDESSTFRMGTWEFEAFLGPTAAYYTPPTCTRGLAGQDCDLSHLYPSRRALPCNPHFPKGG